MKIGGGSYLVYNLKICNAMCRFPLQVIHMYTEPYCLLSLQT